MKTNKLASSAFFLALALVLPFLTGQLPQLGSMLSPMHIPVLLCGFICGWPYGLAVGFIAPLLRFLLFGMPPVFPVGIAMAFELATYGAVAGWVFNRVWRGLPGIYTALLAAMVSGRLVWGIVSFILAKLFALPFSMNVFISAVLINALPGIILHLITVPFVVLAVERRGLLNPVRR